MSVTPMMTDLGHQIITKLTVDSIYKYIPTYFYKNIMIFMYMHVHNI